MQALPWTFWSIMPVFSIATYVELETADWQRVIDTNLTSAFVIGARRRNGLIARGHGKIVNIGSLTSELARATIAPYTVAKAGSRC